MFTGFKVKFYYRQLYIYDFIKEYVENTKKPEVAILFFFLWMPNYEEFAPDNATVKASAENSNLL